MFRITLRINLFLVLLILVSLFSLIQQINGDICDSCTCIENSCDSLNGNECSNDDIHDVYICDGNTEQLKNQSIDLNSILWPSRNTTSSATFNNFKFTYLTKYFQFTNKIFIKSINKND